jgi:hypothetical protein
MRSVLRATLSAAMDTTLSLASARLFRDENGIERVTLDLAEFAALVNAASIARHGVPDTTVIVRKLEEVLAEGGEYIDLDDFLAEYDAAHG